MRRPLLAVAAAAALVVSATAARPLARHLPTAADLAATVRSLVTIERLEQHSRRFVEHDRVSGSAGENAAIDYIVSTLRADGVPVELDTLQAYVSNPVSSRLELLDAAGGVELSPKSITVAFSPTVRDLEATLVDVGDADSLPALDPASGERLGFAGSLASRADLRRSLVGNIALVTGTPGPDEAWKLQQLGAVGAVFINPYELLNDLVLTTVWGTPSSRNAHRIPQLPIAEVRRSDGDAIRRWLTAGKPGVIRRVRLSAETETGWKPLRLAVARIPAGLNPSADAPYVLFGGHIDAWYKGATDEAAANAAMLETARAFYKNRAQLRRGLVVAWWPGHSNGRYAGSTWFVDHKYAELRNRAIAYLNVDLIGQKGAKHFSAAASASLGGLATDVVRTRTGTTDLRIGRPGRAGDQSFLGLGLPSLQLMRSRPAADAGSWWWHTPDDTFDKIDFDVLKGDADLYIDAIAALTSAPVPPIDAIAEIRTLGTLLAQRQTASQGRLDLSDAVQRQVRLLALLQELQPRLGALASRKGASGGDAGMAIVNVVRPVQRVLYTLEGNYHQDPAVSFGQLPGLSGASTLASARTEDERRFAETTLRREQNRLVEALDQSIREAELLRQRIGR
jgi:hypothetical protein